MIALRKKKRSRSYLKLLRQNRSPLAGRASSLVANCSASPLPAPWPRSRPILLLDEPFAALDAPSRQRISNNLHQWARRRGIPVLTVTHNLEEVFASGDEVLTMEEGRIMAQGTPERVLKIQRESLLHVLHAVPAPLPRRIASLAGKRSHCLGIRNSHIAIEGNVVVWASAIVCFFELRRST